MINTKDEEKDYQITLKTSELEFIKDVLMGFDEFMSFITMSENHAEFDRGDWDIEPYLLANKIFKQYYDEDGELR